MRFSISYLLVATAFVAILFALPLEIISTLLVCSFLIAILAFPLLAVSWLTRSRRDGRPAKVERAILQFLIRSFGLSLVIVVVGAFAAYFGMLSR